MFAQISLVLVNAAICHCFAEFEMFPGFGKPARPRYQPIDSASAMDTESTNYTESTVDTKSTIKTTTHQTTATAFTTTTTTTELPNFDCPENEKPSNIGSYEVPSQRDLVLLVRKTLIKKFQSYNRKALYVLRDIKEASKAATLLANKCHGNQYKECVKNVKYHCSIITKKLITTVEEHKRNITFFTQGQVCNMPAMATDPIMLLKTLAAEDVTLTFALPAFLRLLSDCRDHCRGNYTTSTAKKPTRRLSDQAFLVKHILSNNVKEYTKI